MCKKKNLNSAAIPPTTGLSHLVIFLLLEVF